MCSCSAEAWVDGVLPPIAAPSRSDCSSTERTGACGCHCACALDVLRCVCACCPPPEAADGVGITARGVCCCRDGCGGGGGGGGCDCWCDRICPWSCSRLCSCACIADGPSADGTKGGGELSADGSASPDARVIVARSGAAAAEFGPAGFKVETGGGSEDAVEDAVEDAGYESSGGEGEAERGAGAGADARWWWV